MMTIKHITVEQAQQQQQTGATYLDVRSVPEFEAGHPKGAYNVPLLHSGPAGMSPNPEFLDVVKKAFPADARLVVGCKAGSRSLKAAEMLQAAGYTGIVDQRAGFEGGGGEAGWRPRGLPTSAEAEPGRAYETLRGKR